MKGTLGLTLSSVLLLAGAPAQAEEQKPYSVVDGKVDTHTYEGWQAFRHAGCGTCHGGAGQGGAAPSLVVRLKGITHEQFKTSVTNGKNLMPPWGTNKLVMENLDKIYAYLKGRSDGVLSEGKLEKQ